VYPVGYKAAYQEDETGVNLKGPSGISIEFRGQTLEFNLTPETVTALIETDEYAIWLASIRDIKTRARIVKDTSKMRRGLLGDWKEIDGIFEMRLDYGPGYRVYYAKFGKVVIILLGGGDKSSQQSDISKAQKLWKELKDETKEV